MAHEEIERAVEQVESGQKASKKDTIKYLINIAVVLIVTFVALFLTLKDNFFFVVNKLLETMSLNPDVGDYRLLWLFAFFGVMVLTILIRSLILFFFARLYSNKYHYNQAFCLDMIGTFYNAVTPSSTGGQVMQAYTLKKQGIPISSAISMLVMYSIIYQIWLIVGGIVSLIVKYSTITGINTFSFTLNTFQISLPTWLLIIFGFAVNVGVIGVLLLMSYWKGFHNFIMGPVITLLSKIKIIKNPDSKRENLRVQIENFKIETRRIFSNIPFFLLVSVFMIFMQFCNFSMPYFVGQALGNQSSCSTIWDAFFLGNFHQMVTGLVPLPGGVGISEYFFKNLFGGNISTLTSAYQNGAFNSYLGLNGASGTIKNVIEKFYDGGYIGLNNATNLGVGVIRNFIENNDISGLLNAANKAGTIQFTIADLNKIFNDGAYGALLVGLTDVSQVSELKLIMETAGDQSAKAFSFYYVSPEIICGNADWGTVDNFAKTALLLWRTITFVLPLFVSGLFSAFYKPGGKKAKRIYEDSDAPSKLDSQTFVDLQKETINDRILEMDTMVETSRLTRDEIMRKIKNLAKKPSKKSKENNIPEKQMMDIDLQDDNVEDNKEEKK